MGGCEAEGGEGEGGEGAEGEDGETAEDEEGEEAMILPLDLLLIKTPNHLLMSSSPPKIQTLLFSNYPKFLLVKSTDT